MVCHADVSDREAVQQMMQHAVDEFGQLDIVVSNAYYSKRQAILEQDWVRCGSLLRNCVDAVRVSEIS